MRKPEPDFSPARLAELLFGEWQLPAGARLRLAYSGGLDSTVLLHALAGLRADHGFSLSAIHIDHALHAGSAAWAVRCAQACGSLAVPFESYRVQVQLADEGLEAAARRARYAALGAALGTGEFLVTAQQRDDQAETLLLQLLRGAGIAGLAAMPPRARFGAGELLRPILGFSRAALQDWAVANHLEWIEDPSNQNLHLRRNFLRAEILPRLARVWPDASAKLARTASHAAEARSLLDEVAGQDLAACQAHDSRHAPALSVQACAALAPARQRNLLRFWLRQQGFPAPSGHSLNELLAQLRVVPVSQHSCLRWPGVEVWRYRNLLVALAVRPLPDPALDVEWPDLRVPIEVHGVGRLHAEPVRGRGLVRARLSGPLHIRLRRGGEVMRLPGREHRHMLKKCLQAEGVPPWQRARLPLVFSGTDIAAVADLWVCAPFAARPDEEGLVIVWEPFRAGT